MVTMMSEPWPFPAGAPPRPPPWQNPTQLRYHLARLVDGIELLAAVTEELEVLVSLKGEAASISKEKLEKGEDEEERTISDEAQVNKAVSKSFDLREALQTKRIEELDGIQDVALKSAIDLQRSVQSHVAPLLAVLQGQSTWEEASACARMSTQRAKMLRNRKRRKRRRQSAAQALEKEGARYDQADREVDEWRTREIAKDIARRKAEKMKEVAKQKANEERIILERELELVLIVEKLKELRELRVQKLKKQGMFFPEEDNRFMERVRAAVEEEERQAAAAADTSATAVAIANAEEAAKAAAHSDMQKQENHAEEFGESNLPSKEHADSGSTIKHVSRDQNVITRSENFAYEGTLPAEFYHYYYGSTVDMGTLIEVRRLWDTFIVPGGSRIPGHWVQPPPPADPVWASCLVTEYEQACNEKVKQQIAEQ